MHLLLIYIYIYILYVFINNASKLQVTLEVCL